MKGKIQMKRRIVLGIIVAVFGTAVAQTTNNAAIDLAKMDTAARKAAASRRFHQRTGGFIVNVRNTKGGIYFIDSTPGQRYMEDFRLAAATLQNDSWIPCKVDSAEGVTLSNVLEKKSLAKWEVAVVLMSDASLPVQLVQPEGRWALVNVAALGGGNQPEETVRKRVRKEALRAAAFLFGCGYSLNAGGMAQPISNVEELDMSLSDHLPVDVFTTMQALAPKFGITVGKRCHYRKACEEGWAPEPINEYQKAIWEETRKLPAKPIKIEFDPAKGK